MEIPAPSCCGCLSCILLFPFPSSPQVVIQLYNAIFLFLLVCVTYSVGSCLMGRTARLPLVGDAADAQVR